MPHYADGTEAKVGDHVTGKLYNTEGIRAGTIVSITPGAESCNAMVQFTEATSLESVRPRMAVDARAQLVKSEQHGSTGPLVALWTCVDYCATNELTKVG